MLLVARWRRHLDFFWFQLRMSEGGMYKPLLLHSIGIRKDEGCTIGVMEFSGRVGTDRVNGWGLLLFLSEEARRRIMPGHHHEHFGFEMSCFPT